MSWRTASTILILLSAGMIVAGAITGFIDFLNYLDNQDRFYFEEKSPSPVKLWIVYSLLGIGAAGLTTGLLIDHITAPICSVCYENFASYQNADGNYICKKCELKAKIAAETPWKCPKDTHVMTKEVIMDDIIIDRCSTCGSVFLDCDELGKIRKRIDDNHSGDYLMGIIVGQAVGQAVANASSN